MRPEEINFLLQRSLYGMNPKTPKDFWNSEHLGIPVTEKKSNDVQSEYPKLPEYKSQFATIGVSLENIDANREIGMLQGYTFAKREMGSGRNRQRINYLEPERESQIVRYVEEDIKQTTKLCKEMLNMKYGTYSGIVKVVFNNPATVVFWADGTKTIVKAGKGDRFDPEKGLAMAIAKRALGNEGNYYNVFREHLPKTKVVKKTTKKSATTRKKAAKQTGRGVGVIFDTGYGLIENRETGEKFIAEPKLNKLLAEKKEAETK